MTGSIVKPFQKFCSWLKKWAIGLPNIAVGIILFLLATNIGGAALTSISIVFMFVASGLVKTDMPVKMYIKYFAELTICALLGVIATINYPLCLIINFFAMFFIIYINADEFLPRNHFMYGFAFMMTQMYHPLSPVNIILCIVICALSFSIIGLYLCIRKRRIPRLEFDSDIKNAFSILSEAFLEKKSSDGAENYSATADGFCLKIYPTLVKQGSKLNDVQAWYYHVLLYIEQLHYMLAEDLFSSDPVSKMDEGYYSDLAKIFKNAANDPKQSAYYRLGTAIELFLDTHRYSDKKNKERWNILLRKFAAELHSRSSKYENDISFYDIFGIQIQRMRKNFSRHSGVFRFALKTALLNLICFAIAYPMTFVKSVWLPLTVYCMLMTFHKDESKRAASRIWGTIFGLAVYALFTEFLPGDARIKSIVIMFAAFSLMFTFTDQAVIALIGTQSSVGSLIPNVMDLPNAILARFAAVLAAAFIVWIGGTIIFKTEKSDAMKYHLKNLLFYFRSFASDFKGIINNEKLFESRGGGKKYFIDERLFLIQMYVNELEKISRSDDVQEKGHLTAAILPSCRAFRLEMIHLFMIYDFEHISKNHIDYFYNEITTIQTELENTILKRNFNNTYSKYDVI